MHPCDQITDKLSSYTVYNLLMGLVEIARGGGPNTSC